MERVQHLERQVMRLDRRIADLEGRHSGTPSARAPSACASPGPAAPSASASARGPSAASLRSASLHAASARAASASASASPSARALLASASALCDLGPEAQAWCRRFADGLEEGSPEWIQALDVCLDVLHVAGQPGRSDQPQGPRADDEAHDADRPRTT